MINEDLKKLLSDMRQNVGDNYLKSNEPHEQAAARLIFTPAMEEIVTFIEAEAERSDSGPVIVLKAMEEFVILALMMTATLTAGSDDVSLRVVLKSASNINERCKALVGDLKTAMERFRHAH